jgi:catechol 2,3-dioxygenase-like lactoylglutathione lyase family enzyme
MTENEPTPEVKQLRLVVEADDFDEAVVFYRDVLGLREEFSVESEGGAVVMALQAGRATLEIVNPAQRRLIDELEVGREVSPKFRLAFEVTNAEADTARLVEAGAVDRRAHGDTVAITQLQTGGAGRSADHPFPGARPANRLIELLHFCGECPSSLPTFATEGRRWALWARARSS